MRIGQGIDVHKLVEGRPCILAGVDIPHVKGLLGHSDADVVTHAVIDAILGAMAWGDIGQWFPDTDQSFKNADSLVLLDNVVEKLSAAGYEIGNLDVTVVAQEPKLAPHIAAMRANIATVLDSEVSDISIKATTSEGLGFTGTGEGILASAQVLVHKQLSANKFEQPDTSNSTDYRMLPGQTLAYIGDAVYEVYVRKQLIERGFTKGHDLHRRATKYVSASSQAERLRQIESMLSEDEMAVLRRGRNSKGGVLPKNANVTDYRYSTGLEALIGFLYLTEKRQRMEEIIKALFQAELDK